MSGHILHKQLGVTLAVLTGFVTACHAASTHRFTLQAGRSGVVEDVTISVDGRLKHHNLGAMHDLGIYQDEGVVLLRFDLSQIPRDAVVKRASLELFCFSVGFSEEEIRREVALKVREFKHSWREGSGINLAPKADGATVLTSDGRTPWPLEKVSASAGELLGTVKHQGGRRRWYRWPLRSQVVQEWLLGKRKNHGLIVSGATPGKAIAFASSQTTTLDNRPKLHLTLTFPGSAIHSKAVAANTRRNLARQPRVIATRLRYQRLRQREPNAIGIVGDAVNVMDLEWKVLSAKVVGKTLKSGNQFIEDLQAVGKFVRVEVRVENKTKQPVTLTASRMMDNRGRQFEESSKAHLFVPRDRALFLLERLNPNVPFTYQLIYDVPIDASNLSLLIGSRDLFQFQKRKSEGIIDLGLP